MRRFLETRPALSFDEAVKAASIMRAYVEGKKRPTVQIMKIVDKNGKVYEVFAKEDALGRPTIQTRDPNVTRRSPKVIAKDVAFKACMIGLDKLVKSKKEGGTGSGLDYREMAKVRSECMKKLYKNKADSLISAVTEKLSKGEAPDAIINALADNYVSDAETILKQAMQIE